MLINGIADIEQLPLTRKGDISVEPEDYCLTPDVMSSEFQPWDVMYTTGSTGEPVPFYTTTHDYYNTLALQKRSCQIRGITAEDTIANLYPYTPRPHGAFTRCSQAAAVLGAKLVVAGGGRTYGPHAVHRSTREIVGLLGNARPTVLWGVASYLRHVLIASEDAGVSLESVRMCAVSGEPLSQEMRSDITSRLARTGAPNVIINDSLGATEMQGGLVQCSEESGLHNPSPELFFIEAVDDDGRAVADGETGMLALTHLDRRGTVLFRYLTGDNVAITYEPCPNCGRAGGRIISSPRRQGRMLKIRGMLVDSEAAIEAVEKSAGAVDFQIRVAKADQLDRLSMDTMIVQIFDESSPVDSAIVAEAVKRATNINPTIIVQSEKNPSLRSLKRTRFVDERERDLPEISDGDS